MWKLKDSAEGASKQENAKKAKSMLEDLNNHIPEILKLEVGINFNPSEIASDLCLYSEFDSKEALKIYQVHPKHVEAAEFIGKIRSDRNVVDYEN
jgi:hypothetical protein